MLPTRARLACDPDNYVAAALPLAPSIRAYGNFGVQPDKDAVKVLVVEDHPIVVAGFRALLADQTDISITECGTCSAALRSYATERPDITVIDNNLPDGSGFDLVRAILRSDSDARILIFTMTDAPILAARSMEAGAKGYFGRNADPSELKDALRQIASGGLWLPDALAQRLALARAGCDQLLDLSERELQVVRLLARGRSHAEIADELGVSYKTISNETIALRSKLNARTLMELVRIAVEQKII